MSSFRSDMTNASTGASTSVSWPVEATDRMNRMYRRQRHIYDGTRRYYLLGRDQLIADLKPAKGASVLEIGCGTGRNLIVAARQYSDVRFFGIDVSTEMLTSAISAIARNGLDQQIRVAHGDAATFDPLRLFGVDSFDHITISYSLSMIPEWRRVLEVAARRLAPGGRLHIVDFGNQSGLPRWAGTLLNKWLTLFDVSPRHDLEQVLRRLASAADADLAFQRPFRGYAQYAVLKFPAEQAAP